MNLAAISLEIELLRGLIEMVKLYESTQALPGTVKTDVAGYLKLQVGKLPNIKTILKNLGFILQGLEAQQAIAKAEAEAEATSKSKNDDGPP